MSNVKTNGSNGLKGGCGGQDHRNALQTAAAELAKKAVKKPPELKLPPKKRPDMSDLEFLELQLSEAADYDAEVASEAGQWMEGTSLPYLDRISAMMVKLGDKILKMFTSEVNEAGEKLTHGQLRQDYMQRNEEFLNAAIQVGEAMADGEFMTAVANQTRKSAHMAVLKHRFSTEMTRDEFFEREKLSVSEGYFVDDPEGYIHIYKRDYALSQSEKFGQLGEQEERLIAEIIGHHIRRFSESYQEANQKRAEEMAKSSQISLSELLALKPGRCFVHVPFDQTHKLKEVCLLVEGDGEGRVSMLEAVGPDEERARDIAQNSKVHLNLSHLEIPHPPRIETIMDRWHFSEGNAKRYQLFWNYMFRARRALEEREQREKEKELIAQARQEEAEAAKKATEEAEALKDEYHREATVSLDRIMLEMEPMEGTFYAEFIGEWHNPDGTTIPKGLLYFLGEQKVVDGRTMMRVKKAPVHLVGKFFRPANMEFAAYGELFKGLEKPMQGLMRSLHRQTKSSAEVA